MIDTQAMRSKMLYLALRGRLTTQNPLEDTGFSLIENNKRILGTYSNDLKKRVGKGCKPITPKDCLFEIPKTWCWERFGNLVINFDSLRKPVTKSERKRFLGQYDYYGATGAIDRVDDYIFDGDYLMIGEDGGNFFVSRDNSFIARGRFWANNHVHVVQPIICDIVYLKRCLDAYDLPKMGLVYGIGAPKLNQENMNSIPIPVPPLAEQHRIVARIEQAFSALDTIDALQSKYADNLAVLKSKLIDAAIQGKLTEQLPEDGTAEALYRQIQAERKRQESAGTIKTVELAPCVQETDKPFEIPSNWKWTSLGNVSYIVRGGSPRPIKQYITTREDGINWIKIGDVEKGGKYIFSTHEKIIPEGESKSRRVYPGDFLLTNSMSFGRPYISKIEGCIHDGWLLIHDLTGFDPDYLYYLLSSSYLYGQFTVKASGSTVDNLNIDKVKAALVPLPPLAEQKRIVAKLEELLPLCDESKAVSKRTEP